MDIIDQLYEAERSQNEWAYLTYREQLALKSEVPPATKLSAFKYLVFGYLIEKGRKITEYSLEEMEEIQLHDTVKNDFQYTWAYILAEHFGIQLRVADGLSPEQCKNYAMETYHLEIIKKYGRTAEALAEWRSQAFGELNEDGTIKDHSTDGSQVAKPKVHIIKTKSEKTEYEARNRECLRIQQEIFKIEASIKQAITS